MEFQSMRYGTGIVFGALCLLLADPVHAEAQRTYELIGTVLQSDGKPFPRITPVVFLHSVSAPFAARTFASPSGEFKFKSLLTDIYLLSIVIHRVGEQVKTIDVGPTHADSKGRIKVRVLFERKPQTLSPTISTTDLAISNAAKTEYRKAHDCMARSDTAGAIAHLNKALELSPRFPDALNTLGTIAYKARNYTEAERYFRRSLELAPEAYPPLVNLGGALLSEGKWQESLDYNLRAVKVRPDDALAHSQLGQSYFALGQLDAAESALKNAKALDLGHFSFPQLVLAGIYLKKNDPAMAVREFEEFLKLHPDTDRADSVRKAIQQLRGK
jgi:Flp pilus assembly protein TadD